MKKKKAKKKANTTGLPDKLFYAKKNNKATKKHQHRKEFFDNLKEDEINPDGKKDFDTLLRAFIEADPKDFDKD